ncbi:Nuclear envelope morphology protein 1 [Cryptotrichosporon argae]
MNTLSRLDSYLYSLFSPRPSTTPPRTPSPPSSTTPTPTANDFPSSSSSHTLNPHPNRRLSSLPPSPRKVRRRPRAPTVSSIALPPPSTPLLLRIALALWSILLAFWRSLVVETRAERRRRKRRGTIVRGLRSAALSGGGGGGAGAKAGDASASDEEDGEDAGSADDDDRPEGAADHWTDPVTRAPAGAPAPPAPADAEFAPRAPPDKLTFRLRSAPQRAPSDGDAWDGGGARGNVVVDAATARDPSPPAFSRQPTPPSILSNPLERPVRPGRLLPNPMATSLLDPTLPAVPRSSSQSRDDAGARAGVGRALRAAHPPTPFHLQKTLILDLDETLIHSTSRPLGYGASMGGGMLGLGSGMAMFGGKRARRGEGHTVEVVLNGRSTTYHVYKRPYVDFFLKKVASWYTLVIYTASMPEYADPVIDWLDNGRSLFARRLYRESCYLQPNGSYIKDLALVDQDLARVCFMDNSPISYSWNKANALPIEGWTSDPNDEALLQSIPVLDSLRFVNDVRRVLGIRGFY